MRKRATIKDVAAAAGVSTAAVSAALSGKGGASTRVSPETRAKIREAARSLEYVPNRRAASLVERRSEVIAVITYEKAFPVDFHNEFYGFFVGAEEEAASRGYDILILNNRPDPSGSGGGGRLGRLGMADGAVVIGILRDEEALARYLHSGFPIVFVGRREIGGTVPNHATFDYAGAIEELAGHLAAAGFAGVDFLPSGSGEPLRDKRGFLEEALGRRGLGVRDIGQPGESPGREAWAALVAEAQAQGRVLAFNSMAGAEAFRRGAAELGLTPGTDYEAIVLEDRWQDGDTFWTRLSSDRVQLGRTAVACLLDILDEQIEEPVRRLIPVSLILGPSSPRLGIP